MNRDRRQNTRRLTRLAVMLTAALVLSLLENTFPPLLAFAPGVKIGLGNVISLIALILMGVSDAFIILLLRCMLSAVFGGNYSALMYSVPAGLLSLAVEAVLYKLLFPHISLMGISFTGAAVHNIVQLFVASLVVSTNLFAVLPLTLIASIIAGIFTGAVTYFTIKYLPEKLYIDKENNILRTSENARTEF